MNIRSKKSKSENKDGSCDTVVREDNMIRVYNVNGQKVRESVHPTNASARREMAHA